MFAIGRHFPAAMPALERVRPITSALVGSGNHHDLADLRNGRGEWEELAVRFDLLLSEGQNCIRKVVKIVLGLG